MGVQFWLVFRTHPPGQPWIVLIELDAWSAVCASCFFWSSSGIFVPQSLSRDLSSRLVDHAGAGFQGLGFSVMVSGRGTGPDKE